MAKQKYNYTKIQDLYDSGLTITEICQEMTINRSTMIRAVKMGWLKTRSVSDALKLSRIKKPQLHTPETKEKLRQIMLKRRAEGYNWTLGHTRQFGEPSWPEKFFKRVIDTEFKNTEYQTEFTIGRYSLDFAWPSIKRCLEIDGEQHYTKPEQIASDIRKDAFLKEQGWQVLRIRWKDCFQNTKEYIKLARKFIED